MILLEERVDRLEDLMADLIRANADVREAQAELYRAQARTHLELDRLSREMREFKDEMRDFKGEMNRRWSELANKLGTLAEDIVAPSIPRILREVVGCTEAEIELSAVRLWVRHAEDRGRRREFDVAAACPGYLLLNETRTRLLAPDVDAFVEVLQEARGYFPHYADRKIIGAVASLQVEKGVVRYGEKAGVLVLGLGEDLMDVLNEPGFRPREF